MIEYSGPHHPQILQPICSIPAIPDSLLDASTFDARKASAGMPVDGSHRAVVSAVGVAREIRAWRGLSLEAAAGLAGISYGYLGKLERGRRRPRSFGGMPLSSYFCPTPIVTTLRPEARSCSKTVDMRGDHEAPLRSRASAAPRLRLSGPGGVGAGG